jgi:hypothetical protein
MTSPYSGGGSIANEDKMEHEYENVTSVRPQQAIVPQQQPIQRNSRSRSFLSNRPAPYPITSNFQLRNTANDMDTSEEGDVKPTLPSLAETLPSNILRESFPPAHFTPPSIQLAQVTPLPSFEHVHTKVPDEITIEDTSFERPLHYTPMRRHSTPVKSAILPKDYPTPQNMVNMNRSNSVNSTHTANQSRITSPVQESTPGEPMVANVAVDIVQGFRVSPTAKQIGGKDNREPLPTHVISINMNYFIGKQNMSLQEFAQLSIRASLVGYKKPLLVKDKLVLSTLEELSMPQPLPNYVPQQQNFVRVAFKNLIVKHSSHNHGQKLLLRFSVTTPTGIPLESVDSAEFETITRRGIEKQRQKDAIIKKKQDGSPSPAPQSPQCMQPQTSPTQSPRNMQQLSFQQYREPTSPSSSSPRHSPQQYTQSFAPPTPTMTSSPYVTAIEPNMSLCEGGQLCKIYFNTLPPNIPVEQISVFFGDKESQEIFCVKQNTVICQIPSSARLMTGEVHINVSLDDRKSFVPSTTKFNYVAHNHLYNFLQHTQQNIPPPNQSISPTQVHSRQQNKSVMEELFRNTHRSQ